MASESTIVHLKTPNQRKQRTSMSSTRGRSRQGNTRPGWEAKNYRLNLHGVERNVTQFLEEQKLEQFSRTRACRHRHQ